MSAAFLSPPSFRVPQTTRRAVSFRPLSTIERYFSLHYSLKAAQQHSLSTENESTSTPPTPTGEDVCVARHHNGICIICLSPRHPICQKKLQLEEIEFLAVFRSVSGKRKRGGTFMQQSTKICSLKSKCGQEYIVRCPIRGTLLELNEKVVQKPELLVEKSLGDGYLAVILPRPNEREHAVEKLLTKEGYDKLWQEENAEKAKDECKE